MTYKYGTKKVKSGIVKFKINGKTYKAKIKNGIAKVKIKDGTVFVLCDNRNTKQKFDSRNEKIGIMSAKEIKGKVLLRAWPPGKLK